MTPSGVLVMEPTELWEGNDGNWSSFSLAVGNQQRVFRVLPSISGSQIWLPDPENACNGTAADIPNCTALRGIPSDARGLFTEPRGFEPIELASLSPKVAVYDDIGNGSFGLDNVSIHVTPDTFTPSIGYQTVAAIANETAWLGLLGLGTEPSNFTNHEPNDSLLLSLKKQGHIGSLSYGYALGSHAGKLIRCRQDSTLKSIQRSRVVVLFLAVTMKL